MFEAEVGKEGLAKSWQDDFEEVINCDFCDGNARIAFVTQEDGVITEKCVYQLHPNEMTDGGKFWPHDLIAVAVYFCEKCAKANVRWNQA